MLPVDEMIKVRKAQDLLPHIHSVLRFHGRPPSQACPFIIARPNLPITRILPPGTPFRTNAGVEFRGDNPGQSGNCDCTSRPTTCTRCVKTYLPVSASCELCWTIAGTAAIETAGHAIGSPQSPPHPSRQCRPLMRCSRLSSIAACTLSPSLTPAFSSPSAATPAPRNDHEPFADRREVPHLRLCSYWSRLVGTGSPHRRDRSLWLCLDP